MASNPVLKSKPQESTIEKDPLAELSRIMGLDNRQRSESDQDMDFGIDLEKELMGELSALDMPANDSVLADPYRGRAEIDTANALDAEIDFAFDDLMTVEPSEQPVARSGAINEPIIDDTLFADVDFDAALADEATVEPVAAPAGPADDFTFDDAIARLAADTTEPQAPVSFGKPRPSLEDELKALLSGLGPAQSQAPRASHADVVYTAPVTQFTAPTPAAPEAIVSDAELRGSVDVADTDADWASLFAGTLEEPVAEEPSTIGIQDRLEAPVDVPVAGNTHMDAPPLDAQQAEHMHDTPSFELPRFDPPMTDTIEPVQHQAVADEPVASGPAEMAENEHGQEAALDPVFADFAAGGTWERPEPQDDPIADRGWRAEMEPAEEPRVPAKADVRDEEDPFKLLAALAAAPPVVRTMSRTNPVALTPVAQRAPVATPVVERAPVAPVAAPAPLPVMPFEETAPVAPAFLAPARPASAPAAAEVPMRVAPSTGAGRDPAFDELLKSLGTPVARPAATQPPKAATPAAQAPAAAAPAQRHAEPPAAWTSAAIPAAAAFSPAPTFERPPAPDIETVDLADEPVALAGDFEIPDLTVEETATRVHDVDDLEAEFANAFSQLRLDVPTAPAPVAPARDLADELDFLYEDELNRGLDATGQFSGYNQADNGADRYADQTPLAFAGDDLDDDGMALNDQAAGAPPSQRNRGLLVAGIVAAVAVVGGVGAFALSMGGAGTGEPALVRADADPVKIRPENPGGSVVPNQDNKVYDTVVGQTPTAPTQEKLISGAEEPIEAIAPAAPDTTSSLPGVESPQVKSEARVTPDEADAAPATADPQSLAVTPRRVRTMIVRPDGTLMAREEPAVVAEAPVAPAQAEPAPTVAVAAAPQAAIPAAPAAPAAVDDVVAPAASAVAPPETAVQPAAPAPAAPVAAEKPAKPVAAKPAPKPEAPKTEAVASAPVELAGGTAAGALWSVQIASQPTREGAQASYEDMARRFGGVLGGKGVNIVRADIEGKGTFWRVRVPAASKSDANILCAKLKTAGGSCFVSR